MATIFLKRKFVGPDQINSICRMLQNRSDSVMALIGSVALGWWGCPRLSPGVDLASFSGIGLDLPYTPLKLPYGGTVWSGSEAPEVKIVVRTDEYMDLYRDAIRNAVPGPLGFPVVSPEYLAAMKLAIHDLRHRLDLKWLLGKKDLVDRLKLQKIVHDYVGGRFALDALEVIEEEVEIDIEMDRDRDQMSYP